MLIAHISDFHVFAREPESSLVRRDVADRVTAIVADITAFKPAIEAVMFTGDLTDGGSIEDYALLKRLLSPLAVPVFVVPGNHDRRSTLRAAFADTHPFEAGEFLHYETALGNLRILALDTLVPGRVEGRLCADRLGWIEAKLGLGSGSPTLILMHHPPFKTGIEMLDVISLVEGRERLGELVAVRRGPVRILCGHIHRPIQAMWQGTFVAVAASPAFQIALDLRSQSDEARPEPEPYGYFIYQLGTNDEFCVHTRYLPIARSNLR